jgi:TonB family protein
MSRHTPLVRLLSLFTFLSASLFAQDVIVNSPQWFADDSEQGDQAPAFKKNPKIEYPEEMKDAKQQGYVLVFANLNEKGEDLKNSDICGSAKAFQEAVAEKYSTFKFTPAQKEGKRVGSRFWISVVFNPKTAPANAKNSVPRLLAAAPCILPKEKLEGKKIPFDVWCKVSIGEDGGVAGVVLDSEADKAFQDAALETLKTWRFAPARKDGMAFASDLHTAVMFMTPWKPADPGVDLKGTPPSVLRQVMPEYPRDMMIKGGKGEVLLAFVVDENGKVQNPIVVRSDNPNFNQPAIEALLKWKFKPAMQNDKPVKTRMQVPISFQRHDLADGGNAYSHIEGPSRKAREKLPEPLRIDVPPKPKGVISPVYPYELLRKNIEGKAQLTLGINANGKVIEFNVVSSTNPEFALALIAASDAFEFEPAVKDNKPSPSFITYDMHFSGGQIRGQSCVVPSDEDRYLLSVEKKHPDRIFTLKQLDAIPKPLSRKIPLFPLTATNPTGEAKIEVLIDTEGFVRLPRILSASDPAFGYAATQAVVAWRFESPLVKGKPVIARAVIPFSFSVQAPKPTAK